MPKKNHEVCETVFSEFEGSVRGMFETEHLMQCFDPNNRERYFDVINNSKIQEVFNDEEMLSTILNFFKYDLNIAKASKEGYMHRNTLMYRLDKIKKLTGLNLKVFDDAMIFMNLITVHNFFKHLDNNMKS